MRKYMDVSLWAKRPWFSLAVLLVGLLLVGCSGLFGGNTSGADSSAQSVALSGLPWCNNKPDGTFMDDAAPATPQATNSSSGASPKGGTATPGLSSGTPISWRFFEANLGFTIFLPATLP